MAKTIKFTPILSLQWKMQHLMKVESILSHYEITFGVFNDNTMIANFLVLTRKHNACQVYRFENAFKFFSFL